MLRNNLQYQLLGAPITSVGKAQFDACRRGKKELKSSRDKKKARQGPSWGGGRGGAEKRPLCMQSPDLSSDFAGRRCKKGGAKKGMECGVSRINVARVARTLVSYHCRQSPERTLRRVQEHGDSIDGLKFGTNSGTIEDIAMSRNLYRNGVTSSFRSRNSGSRVDRNIS